MRCSTFTGSPCFSFALPYAHSGRRFERCTFWQGPLRHSLVALILPLLLCVFSAAAAAAAAAASAAVTAVGADPGGATATTAAAAAAIDACC